MASNRPAGQYRASQGEAWDQIALARLSGERRMGEVLACNVEELDALLLGGETAVSLPAGGGRSGQSARSGRTRSLPPWERL